jgi:hypothetical protein
MRKVLNNQFLVWSKALRPLAPARCHLMGRDLALSARTRRPSALWVRRRGISVAKNRVVVQFGHAVAAVYDRRSALIERRYNLCRSV